MTSLLLGFDYLVDADHNGSFQIDVPKLCMPLKTNPRICWQNGRVDISKHLSCHRNTKKQAEIGLINFVGILESSQRFT